MFIKLHGCAHDLTGRRFGRLVPLGPVERIFKEPRGTAIVWLCRCDCGKETRVPAQCLRSKNTKSCGCLNEEKRAARLADQATHGGSHTPEFWVWNAAKRRCHSSKDKRYKDYGGRGITMCERWRNDFGAFIEDMGWRPSSDHTLERLDNSAGYELGNCAWVTMIPQANNRRNNCLMNAFGRTQTCAQWAREYKIKPSVLWQRVLKQGWEVERALVTPTARIPFTFRAFGQQKTCRQWAEATGIASETIRWRILNGWPAEHALAVPSNRTYEHKKAA